MFIFHFSFNVIQQPNRYTNLVISHYLLFDCPYLLLHCYHYDSRFAIFTINLKPMRARVSKSNFNQNLTQPQIQAHTDAYTQNVFKVLSHVQTPQSKLPNIKSYQFVRNLLSKDQFLFLDFENQSKEEVALMTKVSPSQISDQDEENEEQQMSEIGNLVIQNVSNLSPGAQRLLKYNTDYKKINRKKQKAHQLLKPYKFRFDRSKNHSNLEMQNLSKIEPNKLQEYLESKQYMKIEKELIKSERHLLKDKKKHSLVKSRYIQNDSEFEASKLKKQSNEQNELSMLPRTSRLSHSLSKSRSQKQPLTLNKKKELFERQLDQRIDLPSLYHMRRAINNSK